MGPLVLLGGAGAVLAVLSFLIAPVTEPTKLTADLTVSKDGETYASPRGLAKGASMTLDAYSLARLGPSEAGSLGEIGERAVMWATLNRSRAHRISIAGMLLHSNGAGRGFYGEQEQGRYASTRRDSTPTSRANANAVIRGVVADPTDGAQQWDSPQAYKDWDASSQSSAKALEVEAARLAAGNVKVLLPGIDESKIRFWRPVVA